LGSWKFIRCWVIWYPAHKRENKEQKNAINTFESPKLFIKYPFFLFYFPKRKILFFKKSQKKIEEKSFKINNFIIDKKVLKKIYLLVVNKPFPKKN